MPSSQPTEITHQGEIERKRPRLPRFVVIPSETVAAWRLAGTTVVTGTLNDLEFGRHTIKRWDNARWFMELPDPLCRRAGVDTGSQVRLVLRLATAELPQELSDLLAGDVAAKAAWLALSRSQQRMLSEHVAAAKQTGTRRRRARQGLDVSEAPCVPPPMDEIAKRPLWLCPKCGHRFVTRNMWHSCGHYELADHFRGRAPALRKTFDVLVSLARRCGPVTVYAQKTRIVIQARVRFAGVVVRQHWLDAGLGLKRRVEHPRLVRVEDLGRLGFGHHFHLTKPDDIDAAFGKLLTEAYRVGQQGAD